MQSGQELRHCYVVKRVIHVKHVGLGFDGVTCDVGLHDFDFGISSRLQGRLKTS
jgi:hypothetical protein